MWDYPKIGLCSPLWRDSFGMWTLSFNPNTAQVCLCPPSHHISTVFLRENLDICYMDIRNIRVQENKWGLCHFLCRLPKESFNSHQNKNVSRDFQRHRGDAHAHLLLILMRSECPNHLDRFWKISARYMSSWRKLHLTGGFWCREKKGIGGHALNPFYFGSEICQKCVRHRAATYTSICSAGT